MSAGTTTSTGAPLSPKAWAAFRRTASSRSASNPSSAGTAVSGSNDSLDAVLIEAPSPLESPGSRCMSLKGVLKPLRRPANATIKPIAESLREGIAPGQTAYKTVVVSELLAGGRVEQANLLRTAPPCPQPAPLPRCRPVQSIAPHIARHCGQWRWQSAPYARYLVPATPLSHRSSAMRERVPASRAAAGVISRPRLRPTFQVFAAPLNGYYLSSGSFYRK